MNTRYYRASNALKRMDLWYNGPIDHDSGVAERKGSLNRRCGALVAVKNSACCILQRKA